MREDNYTMEMRTFRRKVGEVDSPFDYIQQLVADGKLNGEQLLQMLADDHNLLDHTHVRQCVDAGLLKEDDLEKAGIDQRFTEMMGEEAQDVLPQVGRIDKIDADCTEVYFWGIPTSGKTCALGTIIKATRSGEVCRSMRVKNHSQGLLYFQKLRQIFEDDYCILPGRTTVDTNFAIETVLVDNNYKEHNVTLVDMAGELFCSIVWRDNGSMNLFKEKHQEALEEFEKILVSNSSRNPKYHFFILEYCKNDRRDDDFDQNTYLESGLSHLIEKGVLDKKEDGVFVLVTKTDLAVRDAAEQGVDVNEYLINFLNRRYRNFIALLEDHCKKTGICGGKLPRPIPFGIGDVCFQHLCRLDTTRANRIVEILLDPPRSKKDWWKFF